jgi:hypothetical protein
MFGNVPGMPQNASWGSGPHSILKQPALPDPKKGSDEENSRPVLLIDPGVFNNHLIRLQRKGAPNAPSFSNLPHNTPYNVIVRPGIGVDRPKPLDEGTYEGTKAIVTEAYNRVEQG